MSQESLYPGRHVLPYSVKFPETSEQRNDEFLSFNTPIPKAERSQRKRTLVNQVYIKMLRGKGEANTGDARAPGLIPGLERSPGDGNGNPPQYSCLENPMDRGAWWVTVLGVAKGQT